MSLFKLLLLPPALLALCAAPAIAEHRDLEDQSWQNNVPRQVKYTVDDQRLAKRSLELQKRLQHERPIGVRKMSSDPSQMFMLDDWIFASDLQDSQAQPVNRRDQLDGAFSNSTTTYSARSPLRPLTSDDDFLARLRVRDILLNRQFRCPEGTNDCSGIGAPDVCCGTNDNCVKLDSSTNAGSIGCCPKGETCGGSVQCDTASGYSACPDAPNGGCCLPGFQCLGVGCIFQSTSTAIVLPSTTSTSTSSSTNVVVVPTSPSSPAPPSSPASTTPAPSAPIRPTSGATTDTSASTTVEYCPTGFYVCSAVYPSGCCRVEADCHTSGSCFVPSSTTIVDSNGVVIVAPTGASLGASGQPQGGSCPSAWYSCAADRGGNCCPEGFSCGEICSATASGVSSVVNKVAPSEGVIVGGEGILGWALGVGGLVAGLGMVML